jgi:dynein heavy chain
MRAVKSVLVMAGALKRAHPDLSEAVVLIRAMRDSNVPKFLSDDLPLFHAIVSDLFPGVAVPSNELGELQVAVEAQLAAAGLQRVDAYTAKIMQLYETFNVRFGAVIVGPTFAGKTACYRTRRSGHGWPARGRQPKNELFQRVRISVLNPKCITMGELYGEFNELTQEWTDGLASSLIRGCVDDETEDRKWTVFDGPIDALWIENMNTVLDDNMTLCLANGERIKLKNSMRMLFEVGDLEAASPATVSRLGVVYMTPADLGWQPFVRTWLARELPAAMPPALREHVFALFAATLDEGLAFRRASCSEPIPSTDTQTAASLCRLLTAMIRTAGEKDKATGAAPGLDFGRPAEDVTRVLDSMFAFAFTWSVGGSIAGDGYERFDAWMRGHKASVLGHLRYGPGTVFDSYPDIAQAEAPWRRWADAVPSFAYDREQPYFAMVVPTIDTVRFTSLLTTQLSQLYPVFFTGVTGTGKTVVVADFLAKASAPDYRGGVPVAPIVVNFSARTASIDTQVAIEAKMEKKKKTLLGAPTGKRIVLFVDDVNMPAVEVYGAQPPIELLRQLADFRGLYDRQKLFWKDVADTVLVSAAAPPGGGRAPVTQRFTRHFHMLCVPVASDDVFKHIFGSIFTGFAAAFNEEVRTAAPKVVAATIEVFNRIRDSMKPTPAKSHYTFNLRDVSKVFQGVLMVGPKECPNGDVATRLWMHECMRVFHDRLIDARDKAWFTSLMVELSGRYFGRTGNGWTHEDLFEAKPVLFVDFLRPSMDDGPGIYEEAANMGRVVAVLDDALDDYNLSNPTQMKLVFFRDAVEHVARIARILRQPRGNAMLVGVGGSGKSSLTRMACHMGGVECFTIELTRGYGMPEFREDLKKIMLRAGVEGKPVAFLFGDTQIVHEGFLEDMSNVLNTGEVPSLLAADEVSKIVEDLRPAALAAGMADTRDNVYRLFVSRVRDNLHIVLTMSPVGNALRVRCRQFPSLINCCTIDWYTPWPRDALASVAARFLAEEDLGEPAVKAAIGEVCVNIHLSVADFGARFDAELHRRVYTTPKSYLDLINLYLTMLAEKRATLGDMRATLATGSKKLEETNALVGGLRAELTKLQPVIDVKAREAAEMLVQVSADTASADAIRHVVEAEAAEVAVQAGEVAVVQASAQAELDVALPALRAAEEALSKLDKKDITEVRSFPKPPPAVQTVMEAVCLLLGERTDWDSAKAVLGRSTFMDELLHYQSDSVPPDRLKKLVKYIENPDMAPAAVARVSRAATSLAVWVHAVDVYSKVAKEVEPKKARLAEMNARLAEANGVLKSKRDALQAVLDKVASLKAQCDAVTAEKERLAAEAQLTKDRLERAGKLTTGLADEQVRWRASVERYDAQITALVGDALLSAACISYAGPFTGPYRAEMVASWLAACRARHIPISDDVSLVGTLGEPVQIRDWQIAGLPTDAVSTDSAIMVTRGKRWPLLIDPQEQAKKWIRNMEARSKLEVSRLSDPNMLRTLASCIRIGQPLLLEDVGEFLDPALEPVLSRAVFKQGGRTLIHLGDSDVDYDPGFRLYMTTKLPNPHYLPEVCIKVTVINFTVTMSGLTDQLLGAAVRKERPDVEKKKGDLVVSMAKDKRQLKDLEEKILRLLRESSGNILDDSALIDTLAESKQLSKVIADRLHESERTEAEINVMRELYRPVATRGAIIYFVVADLASIDPMYQFSLAYFVGLYNRFIDQAEKSDDLAVRLASLITHITASSFSNVCRGLFEAHKLLFAFLVCVQIMRESGAVTDAEWGLLLRGAGLAVNAAPNPAPDLLTEAGWALAAAVEAAVPAAKGLCAHVSAAANTPAWRAWAEGDEPHTAPLPAPWDGVLNRMQRMLVLRAFREEKLVFAVKDFVSHHLGPAFVTSPPVALAEVMKDVREDTPVIFILSQGADPTGLLFQYAKAQSYSARLRLISLGQGQGPRAAAMVEAAAANGDWVLLQNCHLAKSWMPALEKIVDGLAERRASRGDVHPDFRLFLTSMPADYFPVPVLQNGVKLTNEPPKGIRANLTRSLANVDSWSPFDACGDAGSEFEDGSGPKLPAWKKLAFGLCFFHALIQERRKFGPLGWNIRYEFNDSDLETSLQVLKMFLSEQPAIPWDALRYVTGQINYGGRVTDDWDRRCLMAILGRFYTPDLLAGGDDYAFSASGLYYSPPPGPLDAYRAYVGGLPLDDGPEVFGMHNNANIAFQRAETDGVLKTALALQPRSAGAAGGGKSADEVVAELAAEIEARLPARLRVEDAGEYTFTYKGGHMDSLATVLSQEMVRFNRLLSVMAASLVDLQRAIRGEILLSEELDRMYTAMLNNAVPDNWEAVAYPSLKPLASWVKDLHARIAFMSAWLRGGQPSAYWLSGFFFPQGFMTGALQNHARKYAIPIDTLAFSFRILAASGLDELRPEEVPSDGVLISGLFVDGARWNAEARCIDDSRPGEIYAPMPIVHFMPTKDYKPSPREYSAPVYKTSVRAGVLSTTGMSTNFVVAVEMPTAPLVDPAYWVLKGAALLCQLND